MPAALLCETPVLCTGNITEMVNKYRPLKHQPGCSAGTLRVTQRGNTSSKARVSGTILLEKTETKTQLPNKQFISNHSSFFSFLIAPGMSFSGVLF